MNGQHLYLALGYKYAFNPTEIEMRHEPQGRWIFKIQFVSASWQF